MESNGTYSNENTDGLVEYCKLGLMHCPSGRLLTSETFQGALNVSGTSLKRKQIWTLFVDPAKPTGFLLQNHLGRFLVADNNGKVTLESDGTSDEAVWLINFDPQASGLVCLQSQAHLLFLEWATNVIRCFSKEPVWWGFRMAIHPQIHLLCVHRNNYIRSAAKETELRAVTKMPYNFKYLIWLEQEPLPNMNARLGGASQPGSLTREQVAKLSKVAIRTQSGRYLTSNGTLVDGFEKCTLFTVSFKPNKSPAIMFQNEAGEYLTVGAGGILKAKIGVREPRREEFFAVRPPSIQIRLWAFNKKFACNKHGLTFSSTMEETEEHKSTIFQLEYVGGKGLNMDKIISSATPSAESSPMVFSLDNLPDPDNAGYLASGLWQLRAQNNQYWQMPPTGAAKLVDKKSDPHTCFEILYITSYEENLSNGQTRTCRDGGVVFRTVEGGRIVIAKPLGAIGASETVITPEWRPSEPKLLHMLPLVNRPSIAIHSPFACGFLGPSVGHGRDAVDCGSVNAVQWHILHFSMGTCQLFTEQPNGWAILTVSTGGQISITETSFGPSDDDAMKSSATPDNLFVICLTSDKFVLLRSSVSDLPGYVCANIQGGVTLDTSGNITPGCIWQI